MQPAVIMMVSIALGLALFALVRDPALLWAGLRGGASLLWDILPMFMAAFAIAGLMQVLVPRQVIASWMGAGAGWRGILIGSLAGAITPGGPFVAFPIAAGIYKAGAGIGAIVAYITAWSLWAFNRLPMQFALLGPRISLIQLGSTLVFPPLAGFIAQSFLGRFATR